MSGQTVFLVLDATAAEAVFACADEVTRDRALAHLRAAVAGRVWLEDSIALDDDGVVRVRLDWVAEDV